MTIFLLAAFHLFFFTNGGPNDAGIGEMHIDGGRGAMTGWRRICKAKMRPEQIRRLEALAGKTKPRKWKQAYSSDCLECYGSRLELDKHAVTFDGEAKLPPDLQAIRKELEAQLDETERRCRVPAPAEKPASP
jgi:hypothetical protein